jgi:N-acetyl-anhydromuramyl-L-alanine amidase AmpD
VRRSVVIVALLAGCGDEPLSVRLDPAPAPAPVRVPVPVPDAAPVLPVVESPLAWSAERERLTLEYRRLHSDPTATDVAITPTVIVLHYTGGGSAANTMRYFDRLELEEARDQLRKGGAVNVSAHFVVDRDGTIHRLQPETRMARHCIGLNHTAIGIENVGDGDRWPLTDAQVAANAALVRDLAARFPIELLIGHSESNALRGTPYFVELVKGYRNTKPDPGDEFLRRVRAEVADLGLRGP